MAGLKGYGESNPLLSALFGTFQSATSAGATTSALWSQLRESAGRAYLAGSIALDQYTASQIQEVGRGVLSDQGIGIGAVNWYRQASGEWLRAKLNLHAQANDEQILGTSIWVPKWAITTNAAVPTRYLSRVNFTYETLGGEIVTEWKSFEHFAPITTIEDILTNAQSQFANRDRYHVTRVVGVNDYEIAQR